MRGRLLALSAVLLLVPAFAPTARAALVHLPQGALTPPAALGERTISGVASDAAGNVYVGARGPEDSFVVVFDPQGEVVRSFSVGDISSNSGRDGGCECDELDLAIGPDGLLYVGQPIPDLGAPQDRYVSVYTTTGTFVRELTPDPEDAKFWIADLELDAAGSVFVLVRHNGPGFVSAETPDEVLRLDPGSGTITARFPLTQDETAQSESELGGLALVPDGSIYVTTSLEGSRLIHIGPQGERLAAPPLDTILELDSRSVEDVDFAEGLIYVGAGRPNGMIAITPGGRLEDRVPGEARQIVVAGKDVYATGLETEVRGSVRAAQSERQSRLAKFLAAEATPPDERSAVDQDCPGSAVNYADTLAHVSVPRRGADDCLLMYVNYSKPKCGDQPARQAVGVYVGGIALGNAPFLTDAPDPFTQLHGNETALFVLGGEHLGEGGNVVVEWSCPQDEEMSVYEVKGAIDLIDPSGNVLDKKTGRAIEFATVRLEFTPVRGGRFGTPSLALMRPQVNPQTTGRTGGFAWDVAAGFWRLQVRAFGYRPFTSATFEIPPEVTGLRLRMRRSSAYQRLIDPAGRVGQVRLGRKVGRRVPGVRVRSRRGRVREIVIRKRKFRTAAGIRLRSDELDVRRAYPRAEQSGRPRRRILRFKRAFFTVRGGRVVAIRIARR